MRQNSRRRSQVNQSIAVSALLLLALFFLPLAVVAPFRAPLFGREEPTDETGREPKAPAPPVPSGGLDASRTLRVLDGERVAEMDLGTYLEGVVRGEMPASFQPEALKAQAVSARTYTLYKLQTGGNHGESADICTDPACCQAYTGESAARARWGENADAYEAKVESAVRDTDGEAILYGGAPILAAFHASSAGKTRAAGEVWLNDLPYLQAVSSPETGDRVPNYYSRAEFTQEELKARLQTAFPAADLSGGMEGWLQSPAADSAGNVNTVQVGGVTAKGAQVRAALDLRSACFTWEVQEGKMVFFVTGHGHGVGLSQYGANAMAEAGSDYREILTHYYTGVTIEPCVFYQ